MDARVTTPTNANALVVAVPTRRRMERGRCDLGFVFLDGGDGDIFGVIGGVVDGGDVDMIYGEYL
eukprot:1763801-Ditylum_brightwellii.AAC.1